MRGALAKSATTRSSMIVTPLSMEGVYRIAFPAHEDARGFFVRTYDRALLKEHGLHREWVQESHSFSAQKYTLRGLHLQLPPHMETKLVYVPQGEVWMVVVDVRRSSSTFGKWDSCILSAENHKMLYVPKGCALGMCALMDKSSLLYKMDMVYVPEAATTIHWNDKELDIKWPTNKPIISDKDNVAPTFQQFMAAHGKQITATFL